MSETSIEWTNKTWNPIRGCSLVSEGCRKCYAMKQAHRFSGKGQAYEGLTELGPDGPRWTGKIRLVPEVLDLPLRWRKPQRVFVNSMSDLFHEDVPDGFIDQVFVVMALARRHTFQILTKRPKRMLEYIQGAPKSENRGWDAAHFAMSLPVKNPLSTVDGMWREPLSNVWLGVSVEDQKTADERIPLLLQTPAAVRFVSYEPALGPVLFDRWIDVVRGAAKEGEIRVNHLADLDWLIIGGESGPGARPFNIQWARDVIAQCKAAGVPVFMKQLGKDPYEAPAGINLNTSGPDAAKVRIYELDIDKSKGGDPLEWPEDLRVREWPPSPAQAVKG